MARGRYRRNRGATSIVKVRKNFVTPIQLRRELSGYSPKGKFDPPRVVVTPWWPITLSFLLQPTVAGITTLTNNAICTGLMKQLSFTTNSFRVRYNRISVWGIYGPDNAPTRFNIALRAANLYYNYTTSSNLVAHGWLEDAGTSVQPPHLHWIWSRPEQIAEFKHTDTNIVAELDHTGAATGQEFVFHVHCMIQCGGDPIPTFQTGKPPITLTGHTHPVIIAME